MIIWSRKKGQLQFTKKPKKTHSVLTFLAYYSKNLFLWRDCRLQRRSEENLVLLILLFTFEAKIKGKLLVKAAPPSGNSETIRLSEKIARTSQLRLPGSTAEQVRGFVIYGEIV